MVGPAPNFRGLPPTPRPGREAFPSGSIVAGNGTAFCHRKAQRGRPTIAVPCGALARYDQPVALPQPRGFAVDGFCTPPIAIVTAPPSRTRRTWYSAPANSDVTDLVVGPPAG